MSIKLEMNPKWREAMASPPVIDPTPSFATDAAAKIANITTREAEYILSQTPIGRMVARHYRKLPARWTNRMLARFFPEAAVEVIYDPSASLKMLPHSPGDSHYRLTVPLPIVTTKAIRCTVHEGPDYALRLLVATIDRYPEIARIRRGEVSV